MKLNKKEILEYQQNRPPYLMIDFAEEVIPGKSAKGYKNLTEAQKKAIKTIGDLELAVKTALKSSEKTLLLVIYNNQNQRRYIGVKLN